MLLALIFIGWAVCLIFGEWKYPSQPSHYVARDETDDLLKLIREDQERVTNDVLQQPKIAGSNRQSLTVFEAERQRFMGNFNGDKQKNRTAWLKALNDMHDKGQLDDVQFNIEVNKCLDS